MKKSSFLQKPKDMLSKSFNPSKCMTSLKLASSRIKLMKNKKEVQVKEMKRELAQLLESGQDQTARIQVVHVIREEKMMAAYELIEIYCELIVARLPIIETQKNCPTDLKEAIASVIFASPRCGDIPELVDVRKHFTRKYGKEFGSAAIELHPDSGVSRMLVEKLSARAPDVQTKIKASTAIAEEHSIKWDPKSFGENEALPPNDLLNGSATFEKANMIHAEEPHLPTPNVRAPSPPRMQYQSSNSSENNMKSSLRTQNLASGWNCGGSNLVSSSPQPGMRHSGARPDTAETRQLSPQEGSAYSFGQQNRNMNFKDATAAAQAAAEAADRASMAARAAAELSSVGKIGKEYSPESEDLSGHSLRGEGTRKHPISRVTEYYVPKDSANSSFIDHHPMEESKYMGRQYPTESHSYARTGEETRFPTSKLIDHHLQKDSGRSSFSEPPPGLLDDQRENVGSNNMQEVFQRPYPDSVTIEERSIQTSSVTSKLSFDSDPSSSVLREADRYSDNNLSRGEEFGPEMSLREDTYEDEPVRGNLQEKGFTYNNHGYFEDERITKQSSNTHFSPPTFTGIDDNYLNSGPEKYGSDSSDRHFLGINEDLFKDTSQSSTNDGGVVKFDDYGSDGEDIGFLTSSHLNKESSSSHPSVGIASPAHFSADNSSAEFSESLEVSVDTSGPDEFGPVMFDDSDGPGSDSKTDMGQPWFHNGNNSTDFQSKENQTLSSSSSTFHGSHWKNNQREETAVQTQEDFGLNEAPADHFSPGLGKSVQDSVDMDKLSFHGSVHEVDKLESSQSAFVVVHDTKNAEAASSPRRTQMDDEDSCHGTKLNFGKLTGGLRNKGHARLHYKSQQSDGSSALSSEVAEALPAAKDFVNARKTIISEKSRISKSPSSHLDSDSETSEEEYEKNPSSHGRESDLYYTERTSKMKLNIRGPVTYFDSGTSDSDNDAKKQVFAGKSPLGIGVSRRTKATPPDSDSIFTKAHPTSAKSLNSRAQRNPAASLSGTETPQPSESHIQRFGQFGDLEQPSLVRQGYEPNMESNMSSNEESKKSATAAQTAISEQILEPSESTKRPSSGNVIIQQDSDKKASRGHPKLPDYDTIAARLQALRTNRQ